MDFELTDQQRLTRTALRQFLTKECPIEYVRECDEAERFPHELYAKLAPEGWLGLPIPEAYGGTGGSCTDLVRSSRSSPATSRPAPISTTPPS